MPQHPVRNRILAGAMLLAALVAAVALLVAVGGYQTWFAHKQVLKVRFDAAPNIKIGSPVLLAGHPVGRVDGVKLVEVPCDVNARPGQKCYVAEVTVVLSEQYLVYENARITITQALVGQSAVINMEDVGHGKRAAGPLKGVRASAFAAAADELGIHEEQRTQIAQTIADLQATMQSIRKDVPEILAKLKVVGDNITEVSDKARTSLDKVGGMLDENRENVKTAVANVRGVTEKADQGAGEIVGNLKTASADIKAASAEVKGILEENRTDVRKTLANAAEASETFKTTVADLSPKLKDAGERLRASLEDFRSVAADARTIFATNRVRMATTMQNFNETSEHLKALAKEVRRAPWRLFATPEKEEVESLNLYDAARAFAAAASDLDSVSDTLGVLRETGKAGENVKPEMDEMLKRLDETFKTYQQAEEALLKEFERIKK